MSIDVFFELINNNLEYSDSLEGDKIILFGLVLRADDNKAINYTQFENENPFSSNVSHLMNEMSIINTYGPSHLLSHKLPLTCHLIGREQDWVIRLH